MAYMEYTNVKVPLETAWLETDKDVRDMIQSLAGLDAFASNVVVMDAAIGRSSLGPWVEGDIQYKVMHELPYYSNDHDWFALHYDFMNVEGVARVFRYCID